MKKIILALVFPVFAGCATGDADLIKTALEKNKAGQKEEATQILTSMCDKNIVRGCIALGLVWQTNGDNEKAIKYYQLGCDKGDAGGCTSLGFLEQSLGDIAEAANTFGEACDRGSGTGCAYAGSLLMKLGDFIQAKQLLTEGCDTLNEPTSCDAMANLAKLQGNEGEAKNYLDKALGIYIKNCDHDDANACIQAAHQEWLLGHQEKARELYKKQCDKCVAKANKPFACIACSQWGQMEELFGGNKVTASELYQQACKNGEDVLGCMNQKK